MVPKSTRQSGKRRTNKTKLDLGLSVEHSGNSLSWKYNSEQLGCPFRNAYSLLSNSGAICKYTIGLLCLLSNNHQKWNHCSLVDFIFLFCSSHVEVNDRMGFFSCTSHFPNETQSPYKKTCLNEAKKEKIPYDWKKKRKIIKQKLLKENSI